MKMNENTNDTGDQLPKRIHLVEADKLIRATVQQGLLNAGYQVNASESAEVCLTVVDKDKPDLAVIAAQLPGMSGLDLAEVLAADFGIPFIFLTAVSEPELVQGAIAAGGMGYLVTPLEVSQMVPAIELALARSRDIGALQSAHQDLTVALEKGREVSIAVGLLMERHHIDREFAFNELRQRARSQRRSLEDIAREMLHCCETLNLDKSKKGR